MATSGLTGSRIRERRGARGLRQADLARAVGISPAYLNLIEHNRRRIGGKLLVDLARELGVEPAVLSEGAEAALLASLGDAAARAGALGAGPVPEGERAEDFAGRFPGWAGLVAAQGARIGALERLVEALSDRLTHDPHLAASLHEVLSAVTAIRSSAAILSETKDIDPDWQARFLRNMREDSRRLSRHAEGLVAYLDAGAEQAEGPLSPADALAAFVEARGYHFEELEEEGAAGETGLATLLDGLGEAAERDMARPVLERYLADARAMPRAVFDAAVAGGDDPAQLAARFGVGMDAVLRRMASRPGEAAPGLVTCDLSGALALRKPAQGFDLPRFGAGCGLWPLYRALTCPAQPVEALVEMPGRVPRRFLCRAIALPRPALRFDAPPVIEATMLITPVDDTGGTALEVGSACRICPRAACAARREPSILSPAS